MPIHLFRLTSNRSVYFTFDQNHAEESAKELAIYLQFKTEDTIDDEIRLNGMTIVRFLALFGAKNVDKRTGDSLIDIDMYWDRERSCGDWYLDNYESMDKKYGELAQTFLRSELAENQLMGEWGN